MVGVPYRVLCVCLGNICRSPTAEVVLREHAAKAGVLLHVDSAGTSNYHPNKAPDVRSQQCAKQRGYDLSALRARQVVLDDFAQFDLILAMDANNLRNLQQLKTQADMAGVASCATLALMSEHDVHYPRQAVPDPYYGESADFERVVTQCETAAQGWVNYWLTHDKAAITPRP